MLGALEGGVGDLLAEAGDFEGEGANQRGAGFEVVEDVLDGVAVGGGGGFDGDGVAFRVGAGLDPEGFGVVVARDRAFGAGEDEAALGLGLMGPGIGEGAPAGFGFAEAVRSSVPEGRPAGPRTRRRGRPGWSICNTACQRGADSAMEGKSAREWR